MEIISLNLSEPREITWQGKKVQTGIFKNPVEVPILLKREGVEGDFIGNEMNHGGSFKAVYAYSDDYYQSWMEMYPDLKWQYGMFGENLTIRNMNDHVIYVGDVFDVGEATIQACQPRHPCYKHGIKFGTQEASKKFIEFGKPGVYFKVLKEGKVVVGDKLVLTEKGDVNLSIATLFKMSYEKVGDADLLERVLENPILPDSAKENIRKKQIS